MRTNIEIDDELMAAAMKGGQFKTKRETVEAGLRLLARRAAYQKIRAMRGKLHWDDSDAAWEAERQRLSASDPSKAAAQKAKAAAQKAKAAALAPRRNASRKGVPA